MWTAISIADADAKYINRYKAEWASLSFLHDSRMKQHYTQLALQNKSSPGMQMMTDWSKIGGVSGDSGFQFVDSKMAGPVGPNTVACLTSMSGAGKSQALGYEQKQLQNLDADIRTDLRQFKQAQVRAQQQNQAQDIDDDGDAEMSVPPIDYDHVDFDKVTIVNMAWNNRVYEEVRKIFSMSFVFFSEL